MPKKILIPLSFCLVMGLNAQTNWFNTGQNADLMVSGKNFNHTGGYLNHPNGIATDGTHFLLCDRFNNRILVWNQLPESWDDQPDLVLGQPDFTANDPGDGKHQLNWVGNVSAAPNGKVAAADTENDRILLWNSFPTQNGQAADVSLFLPAYATPGTGTLYGWPWGVWTDGNRLAAVATGGGALLFWNSFPTADNTPPDYVIKLTQFGTPRNISTDGSSYFFVGDHNAKVTGNPGTFFWNSYPTLANQSYDFYRDEWIKGEKLPDGKLVAGGIFSVYVWNQMPDSGDDAPNVTLNYPFYKNGDGVDVAYADGKLFVNNYNGNNVLVFNDLPQTTSDLPDFAIGAPAVEAQTLDSIYYTQNPVPVTDGARLIVSSDFDRALYIWDAFPTYSGQPYDHKIPMPQNVPLWAATLHNNTLVAGARNSVSVWTDVAQLDNSPSYQLINNIGDALLDDIRGVALDDQYFFVATKAGKLYGWQGLPNNTSQQPQFSLNSSSGGPFGYLYSDGEFLCAARPEPPTGVDVYRIADLAAGITTPYKVINSGAVHINQASQAATYNGALAITSRGDHRVLLWENEADWGKYEKLVVLGQPDLQSFEAGIGLNRLFMPSTLLPRERELWVGEFKFSSRVLKYSYDDATSVSQPELQAELSATLSPNPCAATCTLSFECPAEGIYCADLLDAHGRLLASLYEGSLSAGTEMNVSLDSSYLSSGIYFIRVAGPGVRKVLRLVHP